ncbi:unnamed protein product [Orchesella dallaii]|uniref:Uncharacterized protein n=1 Tax=Orchesella dallaii TaxID=48710 RepID=A0ABP1RGL0_9HEXA
MSNSIAWDFALEQVLLANAIASTKQKHTSGDLLLLSDFEFPTKKARHFILQADIKEWFPFKPVTIPNGIVIPTSANSILFHEAQVVSVLTSTLLLFIGIVNENVHIGCFACSADTLVSYWKQKRYHKTFGVTLETIPRWTTVAYENIQQHWSNLHSNIYFENETPFLDDCKSIAKYNQGNYEYLQGEHCDTFKLYFEHINCSSLFACAFFQSMSNLQRDTQLEFGYHSKVVSYGANHVKFGYQILLPKVNYFEANLSAFLTPFNIDVWLCFGLTFAAISLWLILVEKHALNSVLFWQFSVLLEQDMQLKKPKDSWADSSSWFGYS